MSKQINIQENNSAQKPPYDSNLYIIYASASYFGRTKMKNETNRVTSFSSVGWIPSIDLKERDAWFEFQFSTINAKDHH